MEQQLAQPEAELPEASTLEQPPRSHAAQRQKRQPLEPEEQSLPKSSRDLQPWRRVLDPLQTQEAQLEQERQPQAEAAQPQPGPQV